MKLNVRLHYLLLNSLKLKEKYFKTNNVISGVYVPGCAGSLTWNLPELEFEGL
jgi:hypothetical protein